MPPPPVPFFVGRTVTAREQSIKWSRPLLALHPRSGHAFTEPRATTALFVPFETLVSVTPRLLDDPGWAAIELVGEMSRVDRPERVTLAPLAPEDAERLARAISARYGLPRVPVDVPAAALASLPERTFVRTEGTYRSYHCEMPNFEGVLLSSRSLSLRQGARYRVIGFLEVGRRSDDPGLPPVGYSGPRLNALFGEEVGEP